MTDTNFNEKNDERHNMNDSQDARPNIFILHRSNVSRYLNLAFKGRKVCLFVRIKFLNTVNRLIAVVVIVDNDDGV